MKNFLQFLRLGLVLGCLCVASVAQGQSGKTERPAEDHHSLQSDWAKAKWTTNDAPYRQLRTEIESGFKARSAQQMEGMLRQWQEAAIKKPKDEAAAFKWAYGYFRYSARTGQRDLMLLGKILRSLENANLPECYETARMRFLISARTFATPDLLPLGKRLLERNSQDYDVAYFMIDMFNVRDAEQRKQATQVASRLTEIAPLRPGAHASVGWVYYRIWINTHNAEDAKSSIAAYQRYLQLAPADDVFRPKAQRMIAQMQR